MNKLFRWLLGIAAIVGILQYHKIYCAGIFGSDSAFGVEFS